MFRFKQFTIHQDQCAMKVGTDGVLLGAWSAGHQAKRILDIGTGTGLIALLLAQRNADAQIDALEIDEKAATQAAQNVAMSPWANRVQVHHQDVKVFAKDPARKAAYDWVICNPPFFQNAYKTPKQNRNLARHNDSLPFSDLLQAVKAVLHPQGTFELILPSQEAQQLLSLAKAQRFHCSHITTTKAHKNKPPKRFLMRFIQSVASPPKPCLTAELIMGDGRGTPYTTAYKTLTKAFYLHF